ncbi:ATP-binding protein [Micromonospora sp. NPDC048830]|uniref:ATP-binding protein n=1 Tax=Micromonospora sp. NPDC048830 TaxID=3364257 RepID=UPI0037246F54
MVRPAAPPGSSGGAAGSSSGAAGVRIIRRADRVGDAFRRGWSTKSTGRGLGLALVGQVVQRYGGRAEVGRSVDGGTLFTVRLPVPAPIRAVTP